MRRSWKVPRWLSLAVPWLALLGIVALFELPDAVITRSVRPVADLIVVLAVHVVSLRLRPALGRPIRWALLLYVILLLLFRIDRSAMQSFMGQEPLIYDQFLMTRHLFVLVSDVWSWKLGALLAGIPVAVALAAWGVGKLLRSLEPFAHRPRLGAAGFVMLVMVCASTAIADDVPLLGGRAPYWLSPALIANLQRSGEIYASVQQQLRHSPYRALDQLELRRRPDIYLIFVESYGRVMIDRASMRRPWSRRVQQMQSRLEQAGWKSASAFSVAPVAGGRSWLAEASIMMGIHVDYEAVFHHLIGQIERVPNLVSLLAKQGYHTVLLAPSDRVRKGVEEANYYNYHRIVRFNNLDYRGPKVGWGLVPDQYSLYHTDEHVLRTAPRPLFFNYHMVSSHTPWTTVPRLVDDWRTLSDLNAQTTFVEEEEGMLEMRMRRYAYREPRFMQAGYLRSDMARAYAATVFYDLELLERYLTTLSGDALVIVMGDHQPPFIAPETNNFESVIHMFARDPVLLLEFKAHGFKDGLMLTPEDTAALRHEGMFSLIARALARCCSNGSWQPEYRPGGTKY
jgi:hypothetical protein